MEYNYLKSIDGDLDELVLEELIDLYYFASSSS